MLPILDPAQWKHVPLVGVTVPYCTHSGNKTYSMLQYTITYNILSIMIFVRV